MNKSTIHYIKHNNYFPVVLVMFLDFVFFNWLEKNIFLKSKSQLQMYISKVQISQINILSAAEKDSQR